MASFRTSRRIIPALLLAGSAGPLLAALYVQYALHYPPCHLCLWQRYPYGIVLALGLLALLPRHRMRRGLLIAAAAGWAATGAIAAYHVAFERGWITVKSGCSAAEIAGGLEDIRAQILQAPLVACNTPSFMMFGFSMANWNLAAGFALAFLAWRLYREMRPL